MHRILVVVLMLLSAATAAAQNGSYEVIAVEAGGSIAGRVTFIGTPPEPEKLVVSTDMHACGTEKSSRTLVVGADGGIKSAVLFLRGIRQGKPWPAREHTLGQIGCRFEPHILLLPEDVDLHILNKDRIAHNVRSYGEDTVFNVGQPRFVEMLLVENFTQQVAERTVIRIGCDLHPWMSAFVVVQQHPYYVLTDESGAFRLTDIPPGQYELHLWHETLGTKRQKVSVEPTGEAAVAFELGG